MLDSFEILSTGRRAVVTVAMPVHDSRVIWLPLESLCRQKEPPPWELILYEDEGHPFLGSDYFRSWKKSLMEAGCVRILYLVSGNFVPLSIKWKEMGAVAGVGSRRFLPWGDDDHLGQSMLWKLGMVDIVLPLVNLPLHTFDVITSSGSPFWSFSSRMIIEFDIEHCNHGSGLGPLKVFRTDHMRGLPEEDKRREVDHWLFQSIKKRHGHIHSMVIHDDKSLYTNGRNKISKDREKNFLAPEPPFFACEKKLEDIIAPDLAERVRSEADEDNVPSPDP